LNISSSDVDDRDMEIDLINTEDIYLDNMGLQCLDNMDERKRGSKRKIKHQ